MRSFVIKTLVVAFATILGSNLASAQGFPFAPQPQGRTPHSVAQVYLLKGLADIFSSGMDKLADKLRRRGIAARVASHASSDMMAAEVIRNYQAGWRAPILIAGHSLGADAAISMAQRLNQARVPVALVVTFGPLSDPQVPPNVGRAINYYQANSAWRGRLVRGRGFRGSLANVNLDSAGDINHFNIEKVERIQNQAIASMLAAIGGARRPTEAKARRSPSEARAPLPGTPTN
jgi:hypothetical protein